MPSQSAGSGPHGTPGADHQFVAAVDSMSMTVHLAGDFEGDVAVRFDLAFAELLGGDEACVAVDMSGVTHLGSTGLSRLMWARELRPNLVLRGVTADHRRVLDASGTAQVFHIESTPS